MALNLPDTLLTGGVAMSTSVSAVPAAGVSSAASSTGPAFNVANAGMLFGALTQAYGAFSTAQTQKLNAQFQADIAEINARQAERSAQQELRRGRQHASTQRLRTAQLKSAQRTALAANGIDLGSASAVEILSGTDLMGEIDAQTITDNALNNAWGYRTQGANFQVQADISRASAPDPMAAASTSLITSAGRVARNWHAQRQVR